MQKHTSYILTICFLLGVNVLAHAEHIEIKVTSTHGSATVYVEDNGDIVAVQTIRKSNKINSKADGVRILTYSSDFKLKEDNTYDILPSYYRTLTHYSDGYYYLISCRGTNYFRDWDGPKVITDGLIWLMERTQARKYSFMRFDVHSRDQQIVNVDLKEFNLDKLWFSSAFTKEGKLYLATNNEPKVKKRAQKTNKSKFFEKYKYMTNGQICEVNFETHGIKFSQLPYNKSTLCHLLTKEGRTLALVATNERVTNTNLFDYRLGWVDNGYKEIGEFNIKDNSVKVGKIDGLYDRGKLFITTCSQTLANEEAIAGLDVISFGMGVGYGSARAYMEDMPLINFSSVGETINTKSYFLEDFRDQLDTLIELKTEEIINDTSKALLISTLEDRRLIEISSFFKRTNNEKDEYIGVYKLYRGYVVIESDEVWDSDDDEWKTKFSTTRYEIPKACLLVSFDAEGNINWSKAFEMAGDNYERQGDVIFTTISGENILLKLRSNEEYFNYTIDANGNVKNNIEPNLIDNQNRNYYLQKYRDIGNTYIYKHLFYENPLNIE